MHKSGLQTSERLSLMWVFIVLNFLARDFHELARPGILEQMMEGAMNGVVITEPLMLLGGIMIEIPITMTILTFFAQRRIGRSINISAAIFTMAIIVVNNLDPDLDNIFFMIIQIAALIYIIKTAWNWKPTRTGDQH